jgi:hypothetical protein
MSEGGEMEVVWERAKRSIHVQASIGVPSFWHSKKFPIPSSMSCQIELGQSIIEGRYRPFNRERKKRGKRNSVQYKDVFRLKIPKYKYYEIITKHCKVESRFLKANEAR